MAARNLRGGLEGEATCLRKLVGLCIFTQNVAFDGYSNNVRVTSDVNLALL